MIYSFRFSKYSVHPFTFNRFCTSMLVKSFGSLTYQTHRIRSFNSGRIYLDPPIEVDPLHFSNYLQLWSICPSPTIPVYWILLSNSSPRLRSNDSIQPVDLTLPLLKFRSTRYILQIYPVTPTSTSFLNHHFDPFFPYNYYFGFLFWISLFRSPN